MSPWNLILMSSLVVLVTAAVTAPVEEREEAELTGEAEGDRSEGVDLSEEDEDDDDSTKKEGPPRAHQSAAGASGPKPDVSSVPDVSGGEEASVAAGQSDGTMDASADSDTEDAHSNANRQELSNGRGRAEEPIGAVMSFEGGASHLEYTGERTLTDSTDEESLIESDVIRQPEGERASDQSPSTAIAEHAHEDSSSSSFSSQQAGGDWSRANGNGRQTQLLDKDGVTAPLTSFGGPSADVALAPAENERKGPPATPPVLRLSTLAEDATRTETSMLVHTEPAGGAFTHTPQSGTLRWRTDALTMATASGKVLTDVNVSKGAVKHCAFLWKSFQSQQERPWTPVAGSHLKNPTRLVPSLNSTGLGVRVLKLQRTWNWRTPADFQRKHQVRFSRRLFQCATQSACSFSCL
ncbi:uncharacterized protein si:ch211-80h18.1 isoform X4 [Phyllopteryx taeniolatus]|uniref:uncharacterized protein si:ch211-80h18.1 isoform X4 n=1 Tax=Phyllopteryx taeniolatus TaxID=161469 RepID=UPI002AD58397|nr:uncharacterized protein si:ch211-80h18.1 isoform X4 [Phyllopteryx taeniolatus]